MAASFRANMLQMSPSISRLRTAAAHRKSTSLDGAIQERIAFRCGISANLSGSLSFACEDFSSDFFSSSSFSSGLSFFRALSNPVLDFGIVHNGGAVLQLQWCPHGCFDSDDVPLTNKKHVPRLGLLAAVLADCSLCIYSIPKPQKLRKTLKLDADTPIC